MWPFTKKHHPALESYMADKRQAKASRRTPVEKLKLVVLDAETTGFDMGKDRILSLATAELDGWGMPLNKMRSWMVYQPKAGVNDAMAVHGITPSQTAAGEPEEKVLVELLEVLKGAVIIGHHITFDASMIDQAMRRHFGEELYNPLLDTAIFAMRELEAFRKTGYANQRPPGLEEVCTLCGLPMMERHTADGDVFTTSELFLLLSARRRKRLGRPLEWRDMPVIRV